MIKSSAANPSKSKIEKTKKNNKKPNNHSRKHKTAN